MNPLHEKWFAELLRRAWADAEREMPGFKRQMRRRDTVDLFDGAVALGAAILGEMIREGIIPVTEFRDEER